MGLKHGYFFHKCVRFFPDVNKKIAGSEKTQVKPLHPGMQGPFMPFGIFSEARPL